MRQSASAVVSREGSWGLRMSIGRSIRSRTAVRQQRELTELLADTLGHSTDTRDGSATRRGDEAFGRAVASAGSRGYRIAESGVGDREQNRSGLVRRARPATRPKTRLSSFRWPGRTLRSVWGKDNQHLHVKRIDLSSPQGVLTVALTGAVL